MAARTPARRRIWSGMPPSAMRAPGRRWWTGWRRWCDLSSGGTVSTSTLPARSQVLERLLFADPPPSYKETAEATGMSIGSIGPTRGRILHELRQRLTLQAPGAGVDEP